MLIEEKAKEVMEYLITKYHSFTLPGVYDVINQSLISMATEQKAVDIDKACDLLHDLLVEEDEIYLGNAGILKEKIDNFRKAMEE